MTDCTEARRRPDRRHVLRRRRCAADRTRGCAPTSRCSGTATAWRPRRRYQAVLDAERNPELFSNTGGIRPDQPGMPIMIDMDDPQHLLRRKLVNSGFTRKRVKDQETSIEPLCDTLIDAVCERGECDFVRDIAAPLPMAVIGDMLGVLPEEREMLLKWSDDLVARLSSHVAEADIQVTMEAFAAYSGYTTGHDRQAHAEPTDDLFSVLVNAEVEGQRLSDRRDRHGDAADPDRRRRDHPPHAVRRHRAAAAASASSMIAWSATWTCCPMQSRRCCAGRRR